MGERFIIYQTICMQLYALNKMTDATECIHEMTSELGGETDLPAQQAVWVLSERFYMRIGIVVHV